jgi:nitrogen fixation-related uncharacterized protein
MIILTMDDLIGIAISSFCAIVFFFVWIVTTFERKRKKDDHAVD